MKCNATLSTFTTKECLCRRDGAVCDNVILQKGELVHIIFHTIRCSRTHPHSPSSEGHWSTSAGEPWARWTDDTPGAKPHKQSLVSDEEVEAAVDAWESYIGSDFTDQIEAEAEARVILEAAAKVRDVLSEQEKS